MTRRHIISLLLVAVACVAAFISVRFVAAPATVAAARANTVNIESQLADTNRPSIPQKALPTDPIPEPTITQEQFRQILRSAVVDLDETYLADCMRAALRWDASDTTADGIPDLQDKILNPSALVLSPIQYEMLKVKMEPYNTILHDAAITTYALLKDASLVYFETSDYEVVPEGVTETRAPAKPKGAYSRRFTFKHCGWNAFIRFDSGNYSYLEEHLADIGRMKIDRTIALRAFLSQLE